MLSNNYMECVCSRSVGTSDINTTFVQTPTSNIHCYTLLRQAHLNRTGFIEVTYEN